MKIDLIDLRNIKRHTNATLSIATATSKYMKMLNDWCGAVLSENGSLLEWISVEVIEGQFSLWICGEIWDYVCGLEEPLLELKTI